MSAAARFSGLAALVLAAGTLAPQSFLDQGIFIITRDGSEIGREEFAIRATAGRQGRAGLLAVATVRYRDRELKSALELTAERAPVSYQLDVTTAGRLAERLAGQVVRGRFAVRVVNQLGEVAREFPVPGGAVVLDDDAFAQFTFVPRPDSGPPQRIMVLRPRQTTVVAAQVLALGPDTVVVADQKLPARRFAVLLPGDDRRECWFSHDGDLLKVALAGGSVTATRLSPPSR